MRLPETQREVLAPLRQQIRCLAGQIDVGLVRLSGALLALDAFFIAVFAAHTIYWAIYNEDSPTFGSEWHIGRDFSYAEIFGYVKTGLIVFLLTMISRKRRRSIYLALILIFTVALLDDSLQLHERLGSRVADALALQSFAGPMAPQLGELMVWTILGAVLVTAGIAGFVGSAPADRGNGLLLLGGFAVLVLFAVVVDLVHVVVHHEFEFPGADFLFTVLEDGGEQITLSLLCSLVVLVVREVRRRESKPAIRE